MSGIKVTAIVILVGMIGFKVMGVGAQERKRVEECKSTGNLIFCLDSETWEMKKNRVLR